jgi:hypothetical protein
MPRRIIDSSNTVPSLREIKPPDPDAGRKPSGQGCPVCSGPLTRGPVPCPDGKPGCLVAHQGLRCSKCGRFFH